MNISTETIAAELQRVCARVISDTTTHREHPTYITKVEGRDNLSRMKGAFEFCFMVYGTVPEGCEDLRQRAINAAATWLS